ncbi:MAG: 2TM domain-containing protein [Croceitalea sp.]|nr:2TM domain-containing protein [Croceitalea sp.]NNM18012.1 2TM domain-containing protein [Croceitalea sp.]
METVTTYERAKQRVEALKGFYGHLTIYILVNLGIFLIRFDVLQYFTDKQAGQEPAFIEWLDWNMVLTPFWWGIGLLVHGFIVFRPTLGLFKNWEKRQIEKYMAQDDHDTNDI